MKNFDVFNDDADGLCALTQLRNAQPLEAELVTGVKRDINLLKHICNSVGRMLFIKRMHTPPEIILTGERFDHRIDIIASSGIKGPVILQNQGLVVLEIGHWHIPYLLR